MTRVARMATVLAVALWVGGAAPRSSQVAVDDVPRFHHVHLNSMYPERAVAFYTSTFRSTSATKVAGYHAVKAGDVYVLFSQASAPPPSYPQSAFWHFGFHAVDPRKEYERFRKTGVPILPLYTADDPPTVTIATDWFPGVMTKAAVAAARAKGLKPQGPQGREGSAWGFLAGPDGVKVEVATGTSERMNHIHMYQEHPFCADRWYAQHLHAPLSGYAKRSPNRPPAGADCKVPMGERTWPSPEPEGTVRGPVVGGALFSDVEINWYAWPGTVPFASPRGQTMDHFALAVSGLDAWLAKLSGAGVTILERPYPFGPGRAAMIEGPGREAIELVELERPR